MSTKVMALLVIITVLLQSAALHVAIVCFSLTWIGGVETLVMTGREGRPTESPRCSLPPSYFAASARLRTLCYQEITPFLIAHNMYIKFVYELYYVHFCQVILCDCRANAQRSLLYTQLYISTASFIMQSTW